MATLDLGQVVDLDRLSAYEAAVAGGYTGSEESFQLQLSSLLTTGDVVDHLTSTSAGDVLSANQGRILEENKLNKAGGAITGLLSMEAGSAEGDSTAICLNNRNMTGLNRVLFSDSASTVGEGVLFPQTENWAGLWMEDHFLRIAQNAQVTVNTIDGTTTVDNAGVEYKIPIVSTGTTTDNAALGGAPTSISAWLASLPVGTMVLCRQNNASLDSYLTDLPFDYGTVIGIKGSTGQYNHLIGLDQDSNMYLYGASATPGTVKKVATATSPGEIPLSLATGIVSTGGITNRYWKSQENIVSVSIGVDLPDNYAGGEVAIATLPVGYRPAYRTTVVVGNSVNYGGTLWVNTDGTINLLQGTTSAIDFATTIYGQCVFVAAS